MTDSRRDAERWQEAMREAEMADLKKHADELRESAKSLTSSVTSSLDPTNIIGDLDAGTKPATAETAPAGDAPPVSLDPPAQHEVHAPEPIAAGSPEIVPEPTPVPPAKEGA